MEPALDRTALGSPPPGPLPDEITSAWECLGTGVGVLAADGALLWASSALRALTDRDPSRAPETLAHLAHPADRVALGAALRDLATTGEAQELRLRGPGRDRWLDVRLAAAPRAAGPGAAVLQAVDASEVVSAERSLRLLSDNAADIVAVADAAGRITWISSSVRPGLGHQPEDLIGVELSALVAPDDQLGLSDALAAAAPGHEPATRTVRLRSASGSYRYMTIAARPVEEPVGGGRAVLAMHDVTEELRAKRELARSEEQFRMALLGAPEGMAVTDSQDRIVQANPALCELLGTTPTALVGHRFREFIPAEERESVDQWRERLLRGGVGIERSQHRLVTTTSEVWVDHSVGIMRDELGNPQAFVHQFADRTAARRLQADLAYRASHDVQTGLANRESLRTRLGQRLGCPPEVSEFVGVLFCDIDNLKPVNDRYGHLVGDAVIATVANRLERAVRRQDVVARVGGDEFVIVLDHCASVAELEVVARNVHSAACHPAETSIGTVEVTITVGAVLIESSAETDDALARADAALYRAKRAGRNQVCVEGAAAR